MALEAVGANKVPSLAKGTSTFLHPSEREPNVPGPVAPAARRPWASQASWRVRHPKHKSGRHAAKAARRRPPEPTPADDLRASRPTRLTEPTARGAARRKLHKDKNKQPKKLFETLAARPDASLAQAAQKDSDHCGA